MPKVMRSFRSGLAVKVCVTAKDLKVLITAVLVRSASSGCNTELVCPVAVRNAARESLTMHQSGLSLTRC